MNSKNCNHLTLPITILSGVGEANKKYLQRLIGGERIIDLLFHIPTTNQPIKILPAINQIEDGELVIIGGKVESHFPPSNSRQPFKIVCYSKTGYFSLIFFKIFPSQLAKMKIGAEIAVLGIFEKALGASQITHPQQVFESSKFGDFPPFRLIYPLCAGISNLFLSAKIQQALAKLPAKIEEWQESKILQHFSWPSFVEALKLLHKPVDFNNLNRQKALQRLAADELLAWQLAMQIIKNKNRLIELSKYSKIFAKSGQKLVAKFLTNLPFALTFAQKNAITEINQEIAAPDKMLRLLQGDVGSGKTLVAIAACLQAVEFGRQAVVIAPTTVLAKQHFSYFSKFLDDFGLEVALLSSQTTKSQRKSIISKLSEGKIDVLIATHAALEDEIIFQKLGLAVIDEQHRFGVIQRLKLAQKGEMVDILLMSATPIPRSLMMALYGDMQISILDQKPQNRLPIKTTIMSQQRYQELFASFERILARGEKIYWICPAIEQQEEERESSDSKPENRQENQKNIVKPSAKNDDLGLISVLERFEQLKSVFGEESVGLLHGKMKEKEKDEIMKKFANPSVNCVEPTSHNSSNLKILVATTVIEVGIDVADATVIVIDNAENFGLAQLHQLRGRVGRSSKESFCILLYGKKFSSNARKRLDILRKSNDGFFIAEQDLEMRGSGELAGTKQSGFPEFRFADLSRDGEILKSMLEAGKIAVGAIKNIEADKFSIAELPLDQKYCNLLQIFGYQDCLKITLGG